MKTNRSCTGGYNCNKLNLNCNMMNFNSSDRNCKHLKKLKGPGNG
jgi:hypothetical protein